MQSWIQFSLQNSPGRWNTTTSTRVNYSMLIRSLSHQYPSSLKVLYWNFNLLASLTPFTTLQPVLAFSPPTIESLSHLVIIISHSPWTSCWNLYHQHTFSCSYTLRWTGRLGPFVPMYMLNILNLNKLKRESVTRHTVCSPQTTVVWWNSEEHSGCSLHQQKTIGLGFSTGAVSCSCEADRHLSTSCTVQNIRWHSKACDKNKQKHRRVFPQHDPLIWYSSDGLIYFT